MKAKAVVFVKPKKAEIWNIVLPDISKFDLVTKTIVSGLSAGTERHVFKGGVYSSYFPIIPGYQTVGKVEGIGEDVKGFKKGDLVFCDACYAPVKPKELKVFAPDIDLAGHISHKVYKYERFFKLPSDINPEDAAQFGLAGVASHAVECGTVRKGEKILVIGLGVVGQCCAQISKALGATVIGIDIKKQRLQIAEKISCDTVFTSSEINLQDIVKKIGNFDLVFETTGVEKIMDEALGSIRSFGRIVSIAGRYNMSYDNLLAQARQAQIIHTSHFEKRDLERVTQLYQKRLLKISPFITSRVNFKNAPYLYDQLIDDSFDMLSAVIEW